MVVMICGNDMDTTRYSELSVDTNARMMICSNDVVIIW